MMNKKYFLTTGEMDRQRLTILNKLYNPTALTFLKNNGLIPGMSVLEIGCGTGHMACELATYVGSAGTVIAIDSSEEQIKVAKDTAKRAGINNIEFHVCDVFDIANLGINYDATYGRWVVEFTQHPEQALEIMYKYLNIGGLLTYEATNMEQTAYFTYPYQPIVGQWHSFGAKTFSSYNCKLKFGHEVYSVFKNLSCRNIKLQTSQAILTTPEEKSVYRLGLMAVQQTWLEKKIITEYEIDALLNQLSEFEQSDAISGFFQNVLISGIK